MAFVCVSVPIIRFVIIVQIHEIVFAVCTVDTSWKGPAMELDEPHQRRLAEIASELSSIGLSVPGSLTVRSYRCGKSGCRCQSDESKLHGLYISSTRKISGKTVTRLLSQEQFEEYQQYFDNAKRLRKLLREIEAISLEAIEKDPRWKAKD